jgi:toxin-antitoxin system PIN domain toxin
VAALCDVNVLLALVTDRHVHHPIATGWLDTVSRGEVAVCRVTQLGLLRLLNNPGVMQEEVLDCDSCWDVWFHLMQDDRFCFEPSEPEGLDLTLRRLVKGRTFTPRLWTDAYLASFALAGGFTMVTFDRGFRSFPGLARLVLPRK